MASDHDERITLYALGALEENERRAVEQQLASSAELRTQLAEEKAALQALAISVAEVSPPAMAKARLMARMSAVPPPAALNAPRRQTSRSAGRGSFAEELRWLIRGLGVAAAAIALVLGFRTMSLGSEMSTLQTTLVASQNAEAESLKKIQSLETELKTLKTQVEAANAVLAKTRAELTQAQSDLAQARTQGSEAQQSAQVTMETLAQVNRELAVIAQPNVRVAALPTLNKEVSSTAAIFFAPQSNTAMVSVANLPALGPEQEYQVWLIRGDQRVPSTVFNTTQAGNGRLLIQGRDPIDNYERVGITIEPKGGSAKPNPDPNALIFLGRLT